MSNYDEAFKEKIQRLRHTGVGGQTAPSYERFPQNITGTRKGEPAYINMKMDKGWVVANPVTKRGASQQNQNEKKVNNDGSVKVFALASMDTKVEAKTTEAKPTLAPEDTEESIIKEILVLQKKLTAFRNK